MDRRGVAFASAISACSLIAHNGYADETPSAVRRRLYHEDFAGALLTQIRQAESVDGPAALHEVEALAPLMAGVFAFGQGVPT